MYLVLCSTCFTAFLQGINQKTGWRIASRLKELLFPGNSSYAYNRGGTADGLAGIDRDRIVSYHQRSGSHR